MQQLDTGWWPRLRAWLFGYDVFISYRHKDGIGYSMALERRLRGRDLACFRDAKELPHGYGLRETIERALPRCRMLVVLGTPALVNRPAPADCRSNDEDWVAWEVRTFARTKRPMVPIWFEDASRDFEPLSVVDRTGTRDKLNCVAEAASARTDARPSDAVVDAIEASMRYVRINRLMRVAVALVFILMVSVALYGLQQRSSAAAQKQLAALADAKSEELKTAARTLEEAEQSELLATQLTPQIEQSLEHAIKAAELKPELLPVGAALRRALSLPVELARIRMACSPKRVVQHGDFLAASSTDEVCLVDVPKGESTVVFDSDHQIDDVALDDEHHVIVATSNSAQDSRVHVLGLSGGTVCEPLVGNNITRLVSAGPTIIAVTGSGSVLRVDAIDCALVPTGLDAGTEPTQVLGLAGPMLAVATKEGVRAWLGLEHPSPAYERAFECERSSAATESSMAWSNEGVLATSDGCAIHVVALNGTGAPRHIKHIQRSDVRHLAWDDDLLVAFTDNGAHAYRYPLFGRHLGPETKPVEPVNLGHVSTGALLIDPIAYGRASTRDGLAVIGMQTESGATNSAARVVAVNSGVEIGRLPHSKRVRGVFTHPRRSDALVTVGADASVHIWATPLSTRSMVAVPYEFDAVAVSPDGKYIGSSRGEWCDRCRVLAVHERGGRLVAELRTPELRARAAAFSNDGAVLRVATPSGIWAWDWRAQPSVPPFNLVQFSQFSAKAASFDLAANTLAAVDGKGGGLVWTANAKEPRRFSYSHEKGLDPWHTGVSISTDGGQVAISLAGGVIVVDLATGSQRTVNTTYRNFRSEFSPDGRHIVLSAGRRPADPMHGPIPQVDVVELSSRKRWTRQLATQGYAAGLCVNGDDTVAASVGAIVQLLRRGNNSIESVARIPTPWVVQGCRFVDGGKTLLVWSDYHLLPLPLDVPTMLEAARARVAELSRL